MGHPFSCWFVEWLGWFQFSGCFSLCLIAGPETELGGTAKIAKLQMDDNPKIVSRIGVRSAPTLMIFKAGEPIAKRVGAFSKSELARWIAASI